MTSQIPILPKHYGSNITEWPDGYYWLVEFWKGDFLRLYWMDRTNTEGQTGWTYIPQFAAGFATKQDALDAYTQRGNQPYDGGSIQVCEHCWGDCDEDGD